MDGLLNGAERRITYRCNGYKRHQIHPKSDGHQITTRSSIDAMHRYDKARRAQITFLISFHCLKRRGYIQVRTS